MFDFRCDAGSSGDVADDWEFGNLVYRVPDFPHSSSKSDYSMSAHGGQDKKYHGHNAGKDERGQDPFPFRDSGRKMFVLNDIGQIDVTFTCRCSYSQGSPDVFFGNAEGGQVGQFPGEVGDFGVELHG
jgi:hypothetical protein